MRKMETNLSELKNQTYLDTMFPLGLELAYYICGTPIAIGICFINVVMLYIINRKKVPMKNAVRILVCSLGTNDIVAGCLLLIHIATLGFQGKVNEKKCLFFALLCIWPMLNNFLHIAIIKWERHSMVISSGDSVGLRKSAAFVMGMWIYSLALSLLGLSFEISRQSDNEELYEELCDVAVLPKYHLVIIAIHLVICIGITSLYFIKIRNVLKVHQRKIQVTNTITYTNLVDDINMANTFMAAGVVCIALWLPCLIAMAVYISGHDRACAVVTMRALYLLTTLTGFKPLLYMWRWPSVTKEVINLFGCKKVEMRRTPSHTCYT